MQYYRKIALRPLADHAPDSFLRRYLIDLCTAIIDFSDGQYVDVFEICELELQRMQAAIQEEKEMQGGDPAQDGSKYLFTVGRTKHIFSETPTVLIDGCIRAESGSPNIFNVF